jgi:hypothetical protein
MIIFSLHADDIQKDNDHYKIYHAALKAKNIEPTGINETVYEKT